MAVVKADGYGHGAVEVARAALDAGATWLGVCTLEEAARAAGRRDRRAGAVLAARARRGHGRRRGHRGRPRDRLAARPRRRGGRRPRRGPARPGPPQDRHRALPQRLPARRTGASCSTPSPALAEEGVVEPVAVWSHLAHADAPGAPHPRPAGRPPRRRPPRGHHPPGPPPARPPRQLGGHPDPPRPAPRPGPARASRSTGWTRWKTTMTTARRWGRGARPRGPWLRPATTCARR